MDTELHASVATFRVYTSGYQRPLSAPPRSGDRKAQAPPTRAERMAATPVTEGPLILSRLATNEMSYLQVNNFTRAVMPRSHIWRVSDTELVVPASFTNYWLITLSGPHQAVVKLDHILRLLCRYEVLGDSEETVELKETEDGPAVPLHTDEPPQSEPPQAEQSQVQPPQQEQPRRLPPYNIHSDDVGEDEHALDTLLDAAQLDAEKQRQGSYAELTTAPSLADTVQNSALASPPASPPAEFAPKLQSKNLKPAASLIKHESKPRVRLITPPEMEHVQLSRSTVAGSLEDASMPGTPTTPSSSISPQRSLARSGASMSPGSQSLSLQDRDLSRTPSPEPESSLLPPVRNHATLQKTLDSRFGPRFTHPLIPSTHMDPAYPSPTAYSPMPQRLALQRRELLTVGPSSLHQDVTTVGGYIGLKAVNRLFRKT